MENKLVTGVAMRCKSVIDSDIVLCNHVLRSNAYSKVGGKVKDSI